MIAGQVLTACSGSIVAGVRPDPLPTNVAAPCDDPRDVDSGGDWEIYAGRLGDALIKCGAEKMIAVEAFGRVGAVISGD